MKTNRPNRKTFFAVTFTLLISASTLKAEQLEFSLFDSFGRQVSSQDYKGVPLFLEFGACW
jgi:hypothetical protein